MFTEKEQMKINAICQSDPEFSIIINRFHENQKFLLSRISHELRNPLALIYSTLQLMEKKYPEVKDIKYWPSLITDIQDVNSLLDEVTTYNHCESLNKNPLEIDDLIEDFHNVYSKLPHEKNIAFSIHMDAALEEETTPLFCDRVKLKQVITNVIKNAIEAIDQNGFIDIQLNKVSDEESVNTQNDYIEITISNNGTPIPKEQLSTIFYPFVTYKKNGTGIGLSLTHKIIESHSGTIRAVSDDELTSFIITIPFKINSSVYQEDRKSS